MTSFHTIAAWLRVLALTLLVLPWGCRELNPGFKPDRETSGTPTSTQSSPEKNDSTQSLPSQTSSEASSVAVSTTSDAQTTTAATPEFSKSPFCKDEHSLCFSMQTDKEGRVLEEQHKQLQFAHANTSVTTPTSQLPPPWDRVLTIDKYGGFAETQLEASIPEDGVLGLEFLAKDLSCSLPLIRCPVVTINGLVSLNYMSSGTLECEARHQGKSLPGISKISVQLDPKVERVRAACWSDGSSIKLWANGKFTYLAETGGLLPLSNPTNLIIGGQIVGQGVFSTAKGTIALVRVWSQLDDLKTQLDTSPEL